MNRKEILLDQFLVCTLEKGWFAPLFTSLEGLSATQALWKPNDQVHSIWEIAEHLLFWQERYLLRFQQKLVPDLTMENEETFRLGKSDRTEEDWSELLQRFASVLDQWKQELTSSSESKMEEPARPGSDEPWESTLINMNAHIAYHAGQIVYLRKLQGVWDSQLGA
ncbi:DinB family protein [Paenibacillus alvei]|uniref:DinB family protein n=1 Tax=Paenibacillus TaxID=44249 RepID=UPI0022803D1A|nr:DinB family protein [Paenibacillus alvei]